MATAIETMLKDYSTNVRSSIMVTVPLELKQLIEEESERRNTPVSSLVRNWIADAMDYTLPVIERHRATKYASEEERRAAQKQQSRSRQALIKQLLQQYREQKALEEAE